MKVKKGPAYNSKILLFGEYTLIKGSMALSIPFSKFKGQLIFDKNKAKEHVSVSYLHDYINFLENNNLYSLIDIPAFKDDLDHGLIFECDIPISYGLGSSGAIVASIYSAYAKKYCNKLRELKNIFSAMESYYHGKSSGLDPLVSYLDKPILINEYGELISIENFVNPDTHAGGIFLLDTNTTGDTQPLVNWFLEKYETKIFHDSIQNELIEYNNNCINNYLNNDYPSLLSSVKKVSNFTFDNLKPMIPDTVKEVWENGLINDNHYLKLCGSGGGGMMLGFCRNIEITREKLKGFKIIPLVTF